MAAQRSGACTPGCGACCRWLLLQVNPAYAAADDVAHWITAYSELVDYKERLLATSDADRATMQTRSARKETAQVDVPILRAELGRYRRRLAFWETRKVEIASGGA